MKGYKKILAILVAVVALVLVIYWLTPAAEPIPDVNVESPAGDTLSGDTVFIGD